MKRLLVSRFLAQILLHKRGVVAKVASFVESAIDLVLLSNLVVGQWTHQERIEQSVCCVLAVSSTSGS